jgi:hypothetical protein
MFDWWKRAGSGSSNELPSKGSDGTLNSTFPLKPSGEIHPSSVELPKISRKRNQCVSVLGTIEVTTEPATVLTASRASAEEPADQRDNFELNWNWVLPKPLPITRDFEQDVVRVWAANAPRARRQPAAREHAVALLQTLQRQPRLVGKWVPAVDLERAVYPQLLACFGWAPRPWTGRNGVAKHLGELTRRRYKRVEVAGSTRNWAAFLVPPAGRETSGHTGLRPTSTRARAKGPTALESFIAVRSDLHDV